MGAWATGYWLRMVAALVGLTCVLAASVAAAPSAKAADLWSPPVDVGAGIAASVAMSDDGSRMAAAWSTRDGGTTTVAAAAAIVSGGQVTWGPTSTLYTGAAIHTPPTIATSADGTRATAMWVADVNGVPRTQSASAAIAGNSATWGGTTDVSPIGERAYDVAFGLSADGSGATAIWQHSRSGLCRMVTASAGITGSTATWGSTTELAADGQCLRNPRLARSADGSAAIAVWVESTSDGLWVNSASALISGSSATWAPATPLARAYSATPAPVAISDNGSRATAVWVGANGNDAAAIQSASAVVGAGGPQWGGVSNLEPDGGQVPMLDVSADGTRATATWSVRRTGGTEVRSASAVVNGSTAAWGAATTASPILPTPPDTGLSDAFFSAPVRVSSNGQRAIVMWNSWDGNHLRIQSATANISGSTLSWSAPSNVSATGSSSSGPRVAMSNDGSRAVAAWTRDNGDTTRTVQSAVGGLFAPAAASWTPSADISDGYAPQFTMSSNGTQATTVWRQQDNSGHTIRASSLAINGAISSKGQVATISAPALDVSDPRIAGAATGTRATAIWHFNDGSRNRVQAVSATMNGTVATWGAPTTLTPAAQTAELPDIGVSADGARATAVWRSFDGTNYSIQSASATISGTSATWGTTTTLAVYSPEISAPRLTLSADGTRAITIWSARIEGLSRIQTASATISGRSATWLVPQTVSPAGVDSEWPHVDIAANGLSATAVWQSYNDSQIRNISVIQAASATVNDSTATWGQPTPISGPAQPGDGTNAGFAQVAVSDDGSAATAVWRFSRFSPAVVVSASATIAGVNGTWGTPWTVSSSEIDGVPRLALSTNGTRAVASWIAVDQGNFKLHAAPANISGHSASWGAPSIISAAGRDAFAPQVALSSDGTRSTAVWNYSAGSTKTIATTSSMLFAPPAPTVTRNGDVLTLTPPANTGDSPVTAYQIAYTTQARTNARQPAAVWATFWPASASTINLATYQSAAACNPIAATAKPFAGRCARALGEHPRGRTFIYQISAINSDGRGPATSITVTR